MCQGLFVGNATLARPLDASTSVDPAPTGIVNASPPADFAPTEPQPAGCIRGTTILRPGGQNRLCRNASPSRPPNTPPI